MSPCFTIFTPGVNIMYFTGIYEYSMDDRGRIPMPPRFRRELQEGLVLTQGTPDRCVRGYSSEKFEELAALYMKEPVTTQAGRIMRRAFFSAAYPTEIDGQGRILIPPILRRWADLADQIVVIGTGDAVEIWNAGDYVSGREDEEAVVGRMLGSEAGQGLE